MADTQAANDLPETEVLDNTELTDELAKLEDEINTLKQVLASKETQAGELRKKLGIGLGQQITKKFETIASSETLKRELDYTRGLFKEIRSNPSVVQTGEKMKEVGDTIGRAFSGFGTQASVKFGEMKSSPSFQSLEQKMGSLFKSQGGTPTGAMSPTTETSKGDAAPL